MHVRDGAAILLHAQPGYTTAETRQGPYALLVTLDGEGRASGTAYVDDGESVPPTPHTTLGFRASGGRLAIEAQGDFKVEQKLESVTILGVGSGKPRAVSVQSTASDSEATMSLQLKEEDWEFDAGLERLVLKNLGVDLNGGATVSWA